MKKVNSLKSMSKVGGRASSPVRFSSVNAFARSKSTSATPALFEAAKTENFKAAAGHNQGETKIVKSIDPVPEHHESHTGPYGVEMPLDWTFHVSAVEVTVKANGDAPLRKEDEGVAEEHHR